MGERRRISILHPQDDKLLKAQLREKYGEKIIDVRTCILTEVDGFIDLDGLNLPDDLYSLLLQKRFWEAHERLEVIWRRDGNEFARSLILLAAAEIKLCKGNHRVYNELVERAYENLKEPELIALLLYLHSIFED